jgi:hypothetical protein
MWEPGVNEVSFRARPHHNVHSTLGVDTGAIGPRWRVDSIEGGEESGKMGWGMTSGQHISQAFREHQARPIPTPYEPVVNFCL